MRSAARLLVLLLTLVAHAAQAEVLADPTRRPSKQTTSDSAAAPSASPQLSLIGNSAAGAYAVIDDQMVRVGQRTRSGVVSRITDNSVCIKASDGRSECLALYPDVALNRTAVVSTVGSTKNSPPQTEKVTRP